MYRGMYIIPLLAAAVACLLLLNVTALPSCPISISTLGHVTLCPKSEKEWYERAKEKKCEILAHHQNCTSVDAFSYHCILNEDATRLVEVCAPKWFMTGYCARFSPQEERIINDPGLDCTTFVTPCPSRYPSTEAYKYQNCYAGVESHENKTPNANGPVSSVISSPVVWILIVMSCGLLIALTALCVARYRKKSKQNIKGQCGESGPSSLEENELIVRRKSEIEQCHVSGPSSTEGKEEQVFKTKSAAKEQTNEQGKIQGKAEKKPEQMQIRTLSGRRTVECDVKGVQSVADLKVAVAEALNSSKEFIEIVDLKNLILYQDDTVFKQFQNHEDVINVMERTRTRESKYQDVLEDEENVSEDEENGNDENSMMLLGRQCKHITNQLFIHIHRELMGENTKVTCLMCHREMVTDDAFQMCDMSDDEKCFYEDKIKKNRGLKHQLHQLGRQWSVISEYADDIVNP